MTHCSDYSDLETDICQIIGWMCGNVGKEHLDECAQEFEKSRGIIDVGCDGTQEDCTDTLLTWASYSWPWWPKTDAQWDRIS